MENKDEKLDLLLKQNADKLLENVDWEKLNAAISKRLTNVQKTKSSSVIPRILKFGGWLTAAAAVIIIVLLIKTNWQMKLTPPSHGNAVVKFIDNRGSASTQIGLTGGLAKVDIGPGQSDTKLAKADVKINDTPNGSENQTPKAAWIIITMPQSAVAAVELEDNSEKYERDFVCLF